MWVLLRMEVGVVGVPCQSMYVSMSAHMCVYCRACNCHFILETLKHIKMNPSVNLLSKLDYCSFASWKSSAIQKSLFLHGGLTVRYLAILQLASQK